MSDEYTESNTTNELLDYLGQDCEWAAECVRSRYNSLKREGVELEAELEALREAIVSHRSECLSEVELEDMLDCDRKLWSVLQGEGDV